MGGRGDRVGWRLPVVSAFRLVVVASSSFPPRLSHLAIPTSPFPPRLVPSPARLPTHPHGLLSLPLSLLEAWRQRTPSPIAPIASDERSRPSATMSLSDDGDGFDDFDFDDSVLAQLDHVESQIQSAAPQAHQQVKQPTTAFKVPALPKTAQPPRVTSTVLNGGPSTSYTPKPAGGHSRQSAIELDDIDDDDQALWSSSFLSDLDKTEPSRPNRGQPHSGPLRTNAGQSYGQGSMAASASSGRYFQRTASGNAIAGPSRLPEAAPNGRTLTRTTSGSSSFVQRNLFGEVVQPSGPGIVVLSSQSTGSSKKAKMTKQWDAAARERRRLTTAKFGRGASTQHQDDYDDWGDEGEEIEDSEEPPAQSAIPPAAPTPLPPDSMKLELDLQAARKFIYPTNMAQRDYQFNIVQRALYDNVLVALPTGLGKTFIAAVVILNFFHWYPKGKIVFVAPTRPLVAQQQVACHGICGLPWDVACEMTGNTAKSRRGDEWEEKRIFYMTPQTLDNDLRSGDIDPKDIVCLVVDEAHRATGNYAYCNIVAQVQAVNPHFRILALTATPGSNAERVQEVIDNLHISLIELRTEEALDIRQYIHKKHEETMVVAMTDELSHVRELFLEAMGENCDALAKHGLLSNPDPATLHPFRVRSIYRERKDILAQKRWLGATISDTALLAEARQRLDIFSIKMFCAKLQDFVDKMKRQDSKKAKYAAILNLAASIPHQAHPKMVAAVDTVLDHFKAREAQGDDTSRVMVFCSLRECVHEIVDLLNGHAGIKATEFIGQSADKQGRGMTQKQQKAVIDLFKKGVHNVIVATSIGEEGLDIGEVDLIICYEAVKDSVRMLQRVGRTGRKRAGRIVVLMSDGPESLVWQKSKDTYKGVQQTITAGQSVTLFDDVPRLIPPSIKPVPTFEELDRPDFKPEMIGAKKGGAKSQKATEKSKRRKARHSDVNRNVPEGALLGFLKASNLSRSKNRMREGMDSDEDEGAGDQDLELDEPVKRGNEASDDSDDEALERGLDFSKLKASSGRSGKGKGKAAARPAPPSRKKDGNSRDQPLSLASSSTEGGSAAGRQPAPSKRGSQLGSRRPAKDRQLAIEQPDDDDGGSSSDGGRSLARSQTPGSPSSSKSSPPSPARPVKKHKPSNAALLLQGLRSPSPDPLLLVSQTRQRPSSSKRAAQDLTTQPDDAFDMSWSIDADEFDKVASAAAESAALRRPPARSPEPSSSPPDEPSHGKPHPLVAQLLLETQRSGAKAAKAAGSARSVSKGSTSTKATGPKAPPTASITIGSSPASAVVARTSSPQAASQESPVVVARRRPKPAAALLSSQDRDEDVGRMGPPPVPKFKNKAPAARKQIPVTPDTPDAGPSVSRAQQKRKAPNRDDDEQDKAKEKAKKPKKQKKKLIGGSPTSRAFFHIEADRDSDDDRPARANRSDSDDDGPSTDEADSSDREHVGDFEATQAPRGYDQMNVYRQSLLTQMAPTPFRRRTVGGFVGGRYGIQEEEESGEEGEETTPIRAGGAGRRGPGARAINSSRSSRGGGNGLDDEDDAYSLGSFVCDDDEIDAASPDNLAGLSDEED